MINHLPIESILSAARGHGGDFAEIFFESTQGTIISCDDNRIDKLTQSIDIGVGIRVVHDTKTAYGSTTDLSPETLVALARSVGHAAASTASSVVLAPIAARTVPAPLHKIKTHPEGVPLVKKTDIVMRANTIARGADKRVIQAKVILRDLVRRIWIAASDGTIAEDRQTYVTFLVNVVCAAGEVMQACYEPLGGMRGYEVFDQSPPEAVAAAAARRALLMLEAAPAPSGRMPVVLAGIAGGTMIHEAVGHGLEADLAGEGLSVYRDRLGCEVAHPLVTVYDDAAMAGHRGSFACDDEGTPAQRTCLIEHGILKSYLHSRITAAKAGCASTGNGRRQNYSCPPIVRMTNTYIAAGAEAPQDIIAATPQGIYVKKMGGGQVNTVNGDFVFDVQEAYRIEHGVIGEPVRGATLIGNGPKILMMIDRVGSDLGFSIGTCGKNGQEVPITCGQPTIRIPEIIVGGTA